MSKVVRALVTLALIGMFGAAMFAGGLVTGRFTSQQDNPIADWLGWVPAPGGTPDELSQTFAPFWEAWEIVHRDYVDQPVNDEMLMQGAIRGMLDALGDVHTGYMSPAEYALALTSQSGELEGIGALVEGDGDYLRVVSPMPGSPAEAVGILPGDLIIRVDGQDIAGIGEAEIIRRVRGPAGTPVHLTVQRTGHNAPLEFDVVRARITIPSVEGRMLGEGVAYVKINTFGERTTRDLKDLLRSLMAQQPTGLVLDLRGNPGGYLDTAIEVVSQFVGEGVVMRERFGDGREETYDALRGGLATDVPLVVLIDKGSASASEIVAGAVQDLERGALVGETTYGKGSVQTWHRLRGDNGAVRVTIARWFTPDGRSIHQLGITPDVEVPLTEEDRAAGRDPQLDQAVRLLSDR